MAIGTHIRWKYCIFPIQRKYCCLNWFGLKWKLKKELSYLSATTKEKVRAGTSPFCQIYVVAIWGATELPIKDYQSEPMSVSATPFSHWIKLYVVFIDALHYRRSQKLCFTSCSWEWPTQTMKPGLVHIAYFLSCLCHPLIVLGQFHHSQCHQKELIHVEHFQFLSRGFLLRYPFLRT